MSITAAAALLAHTPTPTPTFVTPPPGVPPDSNVGTMALWLGITALAVISAVAFVIVRRRRAAEDMQALDDAAG